MKEHLGEGTFTITRTKQMESPSLYLFRWVYERPGKKNPYYVEQIVDLKYIGLMHNPLSILTDFVEVAKRFMATDDEMG